MAVQIPVPSPDEQDAICKWITGNTKDIDQLIQNAKQETVAMQEFRRCFVVDVVTGKRDTRKIGIADMIENERDLVTEYGDDLTDDMELDEDVTDADA